MNHHQSNGRRIDTLIPATIAAIIAAIVLIFVGVLIHDAFATITDALHQAGAR